MEEKDFNEIKAKLEKLIGMCHLGALRGIAPHETIRGIAAHLEVRAAEKEAKHVEHNIIALGKDVKQHFVTAAEDDQYKILKDLLNVVKNLYHSIFNIMIFEKVEIIDLNHFVENVVKSSKIPPVLKKDLAEAMLPLVNTWHKNLKEFQQNANAVYAAAKERKTVALALTKMMHTQGASYMQRLQEQHLIRDGHKDQVKAEGLEEEFLKRHFKSKEDADQKIEMIKDLQEKSLHEYSKAGKLLFTNWEEADKYLQDVGVMVEEAVEEHELPEMSKEQLHEISCLIIEKVLEPFLHSIREGAEQMDTIRSDLEAHAKKLE